MPEALRFHRYRTAVASSSGNQPPSNSLVEFAAKKMQSMARKKPFTAMTTSGGYPHWIATSAASNVVMAISSATAMP